MEKVTLTDEDRRAFQLTLLDDYSRADVFYDLFREVAVNTTIKAMIAAMRKYQTITAGGCFRQWFIIQTMVHISKENFFKKSDTDQPVPNAFVP
jgi:hypothetical protein